MAQFEPVALIENLTGKLDKRENFPMRRKGFKHPVTDSLLKYGPHEVFRQRPRDYKRHPRTAGEEAQASVWKMACNQAALICKDPTHPRYGELRARYEAQLNGKPEPEIGKMIPQFKNFLCSVLNRELQATRQR